MTSPSDVARNAAAVRTLAARLAREGHPEPEVLAEEVAALMSAVILGQRRIARLTQQREPMPLGDARLPEWFWAKVVPGQDGCWLWTGRVGGAGYGNVGIPGSGRHASPKLVHRVAFEALVGPIPAGLHIDHLCLVKHCCNPAHLEPVTPRENTLRGTSLVALNAARTHCRKAGHPLFGDNLWVDKRGRRSCRECRRETHRVWLERVGKDEKNRLNRESRKRRSLS